jgi:hypothetical protein
MSQPKVAPPPDLQPHRSEDFLARYANNVILESNAWDLKLIFGELDQSETPPKIAQHTAITLPWSQVKILAYLLGIHLLGHENDFGRIQLPRDAVKPIPEQVPAEVSGTVRNAEAVWAVLRKRYIDFIKENPEVSPK